MRTVTFARSATTDPDAYTEGRWGPVVFASLGFLLILYCTLFPFGFLVRGPFTAADIINSFDLRLIKTGAFIDIPANIALFVPFGFGIGYLFQRSNRKTQVIALIALLAGLVLSSTVEILQVFIPFRDPDISDIMANSIGAGLGALGFGAWGTGIVRNTSVRIQKLKKYLSTPVLAGGFVGYLAVVILASTLLQPASQLNHWDATFPLFLGNEQTGDRPWKGNIADLRIASHALSVPEVAQLFAQPDAPSLENSLVAAYQFNRINQRYRDATGNLPDLVWQGTTPEAATAAGIEVRRKHWLATATPVTPLTRALSESGQFTLSTHVASNDTSQSGPARVISISGDPYQRNLTLGQDGSDLIVRLRTPFTGSNGRQPEILIPDIFADTNVHHIIVTYDSTTLNIYIDGVAQRYTFKLTPDFMLFQLLAPAPIATIYPGQHFIVIYQLLYYGVIFIPLGYLLARIIARLHQRFPLQVASTCAGVIVSVLLLEISLALAAGRGVQPGNIMLSSGICLLATLPALPALRHKMD